MKRFISVILIMVLSVLLCGCCLSHDWKEATCEKPKTCSKCGKTEGEPLGHSWMEATCEKPKTCSKCGKTEGNALEHIPGDWIPEDSNIIGGKEIQTCTVCGETLGSRDIKRESREVIDLFETGHLEMSGEEFVNYLINFLPADCYISRATSYEYWIEGGVSVRIQYYDGMPNHEDYVEFMSNSKSDIIYLLKYILPAVEPKLSEREISNAISEVDYYFDYEIDGITRFFTGIGYSHVNSNRYKFSLFSGLVGVTYG